MDSMERRHHKNERQFDDLHRSQRLTIIEMRSTETSDRTLKGTGLKAFGFHRTAITVPPYGSQKKRARSPKAS